MGIRFTRKMTATFSIVGGLFVVAFLAFVVSPLAKNEIPSSFNEARGQASIIATDIVGTLQGTAANIERLQQEGQTNDFRELDVLLKEIQNTKEARERAVELASALERMALAVPDIAPEEARQTAIVAISSEAALINKMISYGEGLSKLLDLLQDKYAGDDMVDYNKINAVVDQLNEDAQQINAFNEQFVTLMKKFDEYYEEK